MLQHTSPPRPALNLLNRTHSPLFSPQAPRQSPPAGRKRNSRLNTAPCKKLALDRRLLQIITLTYLEYIMYVTSSFCPLETQEFWLQAIFIHSSRGHCDLLNGNWRLLRNAITLISPSLLLPTAINISTWYVWAIPHGKEVL